MTTRREFLAKAAYLPAAAIGIASGTVTVEDYQPVGFVDCDTPGAFDIDHVTVDGEVVKHVFELHDVEGWVKHYGPNPYVDGKPLRTFYCTGKVRVHWKSEEVIRSYARTPRKNPLEE